MQTVKNWEKIASVCRNNKHFYFNRNQSIWVSQMLNNDWEVSMLTNKGYLKMFTGANAQECMKAVDSIKETA
jgi:hypothetical protein